MSHGRHEGDSQLQGSALSHTLITPYMCIMLYSLALRKSVLFKSLVSQPVKQEAGQPENCPEIMSANRLWQDQHPISKQAARKVPHSPVIRLPAKAINCPVSVLLHR